MSTEDFIWRTLYWLVSMGLLLLLALWFLVPKKWIVWSDRAAIVLPQGVPKWRVLNNLGKLIYLLAVICFLLTLGALVVGSVLESG